MVDILWGQAPFWNWNACARWIAGSGNQRVLADWRKLGITPMTGLD
jgi:hypothetical protein